MAQLENVRHEKFARLVAAGDPAYRAYVDAGYTAASNAVAEANAARLIRNDRVAARVAEIRAELEQAAQKAAVVTKEWIVERLRENAERAMQAVPVIRDGEPTGEYRYEGNVANRALELLGKEIGMFVDRSENLNTNVDATPPDPDEALARINRLVDRHASRGAGRTLAGDAGSGSGPGKRLAH